MAFVDLTRKFRDLTKSELEDPELLLALADSDLYEGVNWSALLECPRVLLLAEAGSGKTEEMREQVRRLRVEGKPAFFIPLEELARGKFLDILSTDEERVFESWKIDDQATAWLFLDAVDELKLTHGTLDSALRHVAKAIDGAQPRAHVLVSCRPTDWRASLDLVTLRATFPVVSRSPEEQAPPEDVFLSALRERKQSKPVAADEPASQIDTRLVVLLPLDRRQIEAFTRALGLADVAAFLAELQKQNAWRFARRPLDLSELIVIWKAQGRLGTRTDQHEANVGARLKDNPEHRDSGVLTDRRLRVGAERLALALTLTRTRTIRVPDQAIDAEHTEGALNSSSILPDWSEAERQVLLRRALFDPATYGRIRFHHRSVQEYLAACRLKAMRERGMPIKALFRLLFAERYGVSVVIPSMRPIAAWLALWDRHVRRELIRREPETLLSMGDPETLSLASREELLRAFGAAYGTGGWRGLHIPIDEVRRIAHPELAGVIREMWGGGSSNDDVRELLLELIEFGKIDQCADLAEQATTDVSLPEHHRLIGVRALLVSRAVSS